MKAVMYHYIQDDDDSTPPHGYYHLNIGDFRKQLNHFEENYNILDREAFIDTVKRNRPLNENDIVLTFDDGLADHYEYVLPELTERDLWGLFYVPVGPYLDDIVLDVHRTHALLGAHGGAAVSEALTDVVTEAMISDDHREQFESGAYKNQENQTAVEHVKRILNYYIDDEARSDVLDALERRLSNDSLQPEDVYMTESEIKDLADAGMHVGSHAVTHTAMSKLSPEEQRQELTESFRFLSDLLQGLPTRSYCHPYGGSHSYTNKTISLLEDTGCLFSFDVDFQPITASDIRNKRHRLPRYDCGEFQHGGSTVSLG